MACSNKSVNFDKLEKIILQKIKEVIFELKVCKFSAEKISVAYEKRLIGYKKEYAAILQLKEKATRYMDKLYESIADGSTSKFDREKLKNCKAEIIKLGNRLAQLDERPTRPTYLGNSYNLV